MFARTERLLLRPGWLEDGPALAKAIGDQAIVRNLASAPWPYEDDHARAFLARPLDPAFPALLAFARTGGAPRLIGSAGLGSAPDGRVELGFWIARPYWGLGFATEAAAAVVDMGKALGLSELDAAHFVDNPASGRVLSKLGFTPTGAIVERHSAGRGGSASAREYRLQLDQWSAGNVIERPDYAMELIAA